MNDDVSAVPALSYRDVSFSYADRGGRAAGAGAEAPRLIQGLSLDIPSGCVTGIVGPNGCGKSTLLKLADGLLRPSAGAVLVEGCDVFGMSARERAQRIAMLPQVHRTPSMTVRDLVMCGRYARMGAFGRASAEDERAVDDALSELGLGGIARKRARSLSGGERQRAFLAMVVAQEAGVLLLDEPTTYLDIHAAFETMDLARDLNRRRGVTVIAVIHDLDLALRSCDRLVVMCDGAVLAQGEADDAAVLAAVERAFDVDVLPVDTSRGRSYAAFPR